MATY